jgi:hypothetical protein
MPRQRDTDTRRGNLIQGASDVNDTPRNRKDGPLKRTVLRRYKSRTRKDVTYSVVRWSDGLLSCTCPGWQFNQRCWHMERWLDTPKQYRVSPPETLPETGGAR